MSTQTETAREVITATAAANGWTLARQSDFDRIAGFVEFKRPTGRRYVRVQFTVHGAVVSATQAHRTITGTGKRERVIAILEAR